MKKIISILLAAVLLLTSMAVSAFAETASGTCGENLTWEFNTSTGELTISGEGRMGQYGAGMFESYFSIVPWKNYQDQIKKVTINDGVTNIAGYAFSNCASLISITIPDGVTSIGSHAFYRCNKLAKVTIGNGVEYIGDWAFYNCQTLTKVTLGNNVKSIGDYAFEFCSSLTNLTLPESLETIGDDAFRSCNSLTTIDIPDSVTSIGDSAFSSCHLTNVSIGSGVTQIGEGAFASNSGLISITVNSDNTAYSSDEYGVLFNKEKTELIQYPAGNERTEYTIPETVTSICTKAFSYCKLTDVVIPDNVVNIDDYAFSDSSIKNVVISHGITYIPNNAFSGCYELESVTIPAEVEVIASYAFSSRIIDVYYEGTEEMWSEIIIAVGNEGLLNATIHYNSTGPEAPEEPEIVYTAGDLNGDGNINSSDALFILQYAVGSVELSESALAVADVTNDGRVNSTDALKILQYAVGIIDQL